MLKLSLLLIASLIVSGCAGSGFEKRVTLMPDQVGLEVDANPEDGWRSKEMTARASWNLK